jgi:hypothetical protein
VIEASGVAAKDMGGTSVPATPPASIVKYFFIFLFSFYLFIFFVLASFVQDPYCIIHVDNCKAKTKVKRRSLVRTVFSYPSRSPSSIRTRAISCTHI